MLFMISSTYTIQVTTREVNESCSISERSRAVLTADGNIEEQVAYLPTHVTAIAIDDITGRFYTVQLERREVHTSAGVSPFGTSG